MAAGQKELTRDSLQQKYQQALLNAAPAQKEKIFQQIEEEFQRQKNHKPSAGTLW